ncbi:MAG TPA: phage Gp37/Gp68 family protein [Chitinivibrionales bacterium]|nr:phage Gp37/Gp68 family protein [Chitinivibrionales bacterium]
MATKSSIEWTQYTWNPITGCTKTSPGCLNCYAERMAKRLQAMGQPNYRTGFKVACHEHVLAAPYSWKKTSIVFVNSMSDLFHEKVPLEFILKVFDVMRKAPQHQFQILTKRAERLSELTTFIDWPENVWMGVSVENAQFTHRIDHLKMTGAFIKFLSIEPMLGPIPNMDLSGIDWVIVGGESGPRARPIRYDWVIDVRDQCLKSGVPFFFKQWGGTNKKKTGKLLDGKIWNQMPVAASRHLNLIKSYPIKSLLHIDKNPLKQYIPQ